MADRLEVSPETVIRTARDHLVWVVDSVRDPGPYLSAEGSTLGSLIKAAGGVLREADLSSVEVTSTQIDQSTGTSRTIRAAYKGREEDFVRVALRPLDVVRVRSVFSDGVNGRISIAGEVRYPGTFDIVRGERLSTILERAGGLTVEAYPYGAVFTRQRAAEDERTGNARLAKQLENDFATLLSMPSVSAAAQGASGYVSNLAQQLRAAPALGRITATVDPSILRTHPELDIIVEPGDTLFIPRRPTTVTVSGEVLNPGSFQYRAEFDMQDYLKQSGGTTQAADDGRVFIVLPDGTARPVSSGWFAVNSAQVAPGSSIIVPRDLRPFDATQFLKDFTQITSQLAVSAASLAVIGR